VTGGAGGLIGASIGTTGPVSRDAHNETKKSAPVMAMPISDKGPASNRRRGGEWELGEEGGGCPPPPVVVDFFGSVGGCSLFAIGFSLVSEEF
jgi:hypothetical protein